MNARKEEFEMYAINVDMPYVISRENVINFHENSKKQEGIADKMSAMFCEENFQFQKDKDGFFSVKLNVRSVDDEENA